MAPKIDPTKIHLGGIIPQYYAENILVVPSDEPPECVLPPVVPVELHPKPLTPLNFSCEFQFPPVVPIPPVYVPPVPPPPPFYPSCSTLTASTDITTCPSTRNSFLTLSTAGPESNTEGKPSECSLTLSGSLCVEACETFEARSLVGFDGAAKGSSLAISSTSSPSCGLDLFGLISVKACEDFTSEVDIRFLGAVRNSAIYAEARGAPNCGVSITGSVFADACESFRAESNIQFEGDARGAIYAFPSGTPDCGIDLAGVIYVPPACKSINVSSSVKFSGAASQQKTTEFVKVGTMIPIEGPRGKNVYNKQGVLIRPGIKTPAPPPPPKPLDFKILTPNQQEQVKKPPYPKSGYSNKTQEVTKVSSLRLVSTDDCSISLEGEIVSQACEDFIAEGEITISSKAGKPSVIDVITPITIISTGQPKCGITIEGELEIDACREFDLKASASGGEIKIYNKTALIGSVNLNPTFKLDKAKDGCGYSLSLALSGGWINVGGGGSGGGSGNGPGGGGAGGGGGGGGGSGGGGAGGGGGGCCDCYHCDPRNKCISNLNIETLEVTSIYATGYPCCDEACAYSIDLCRGNAELKLVNADDFRPSTCCTSGSDSYLNLCSGALRLSTDPNNYAYLTGFSSEFVSGNSSTSITGATITADNGDTGASTTIYSGTITCKESGDSETDITPGYVTLKGSGCGKTNLAPGGVVFGESNSSKTAPGDNNMGGQGDRFTEICLDTAEFRATNSTVKIDDGSVSCSNNLFTDLDYTIINKGSVEIRGMDKSVTKITGATLEQGVVGAARLRTYIYPGTIESAGASGNFALDDGSLTLSSTSGATVYISPNGLPSKTYVGFSQISICVGEGKDKKTKKAWVLMSTPE